MGNEGLFKLDTLGPSRLHTIFILRIGRPYLLTIRVLKFELGWDKLLDRSRMHKLQLFFKLDHQLALDYLCNLLPPNICDVLSYPLCNADNYSLIHSTHYGYIHELNRLSKEHRNAKPQNAFKRYLTEMSEMLSPKYFFCGNRIEQILHTWLHTECSSLNYYLYWRN